LPTGCGPTVMNPVVTVEDDKITFLTMWALVNISRGLRGEDKAGIGSLTAGYYLYDMPPTYAKAIARAKETLFFCKTYGFIAVSVPAGCKDYSMLYTQILVANGISVITANGTKVHTTLSVPAVYGKSKVDTLIVIPNAFAEPSMTRSGVSMNQEGFNDKAATFIEEFSNGARIMYTYYTPQLQTLAEKNGWTMYPTCSPHTGRILLLSRPIDSVRKLTQLEHLSRMVNACYFRNLFPFCRKPYVTSDPFRSYFVEQLVIPKVVRAAKRGFELEHFVVSVVPDEAYKPIEMLNYDTIFALPVKIDYRLERKKILQAQYFACSDSYGRQLYVGRVISENNDDSLLLRELSEDIITLAADIETLESDPGLLDTAEDENGGSVLIENHAPLKPERRIDDDTLTQDELDMKAILASYGAATVEVKPSIRNIKTAAPTDSPEEKAEKKKKDKKRNKN